jgi:hypothetical protein
VDHNYINELLGTIPNGTIYGYNLDDRKMDHTIEELLEWAQQHQHSQTTAR